MKTIHVAASGAYDIVISKGNLAEAGKTVSSFRGTKQCVLVSDDNVYPLYGETVKSSVEAEGIRVSAFVFPHGEQSKSLETYAQLLKFCDSLALTRSDMLIALGGGVTGDLTGFAASTYQRGIRFLQIPTSLLAMVDSSVGGKTAVDLEGGKNQVGTFWQPCAVICDTDTLKTLPEEEYRCGCAEVIKYAMIYSRPFFDSLVAKPIREQAEDVIATCVSMKRDVVEQDEFDRGERMKLNFGHTVGHAVETCSGFSVLHGQAVAIGMATVTRIAVQKGICRQEVLDALLSVLAQYGLPTEMPYPAEQTAQVLLLDKKRTGDTLRVIYPGEIGSCSVGRVPADELAGWLRLGGLA